MFRTDLLSIISSLDTELQLLYTRILLTTYVLQFNDNVHIYKYIYIYTLVILPILKFQYDKYQLL